ncbi:DUF6318 family protein [Kineococcus sp. SYSU DK002]|uniref:DUF6318 family protein n=1 Tax=Kineococcus sp. SYSU DK002 TaxID=3383123 RepID=UPI003D7EE5FA
MIQLRPLTATATGLVCLGLLVGCSNEEAAPQAPIAAGSDTTSTERPGEAGTASFGTRPSAEALPPAPPQSELSKTFTPDGASAFAAYFEHVMNHARETGDSTLLRRISTEDCTGCAAYADEIDAYREAGYVSTGTILEFHGTRILSWDPEAGETDMDVELSRPAHQLLRSDGTLIEDVPAAPELTGYLWLKWIEGRWAVREVE